GVALCAVLLLFTLSATGHGQNINIDELESQEEFGWGVRAYHRGYFEDAIQSFNRSLALSPGTQLTHEWLGRAYFRAGLEQAAEEEWSAIVERDEGSLFFEEMLEFIGSRRSVEPDAEETEPYVLAREIGGLRSEVDVFRRPTAVHSREDGSMLVVSFATHEIALLDVNGNRIGRWAGGVSGFDAPYDIAESNGAYYVTEFGADRISQLDSQGERVATFGESGIDDGGLMGPQFITADGKGYLYVSDWGNRRIAKFSDDGEFISTFGDRRSGDFPSLRGPTGIAHLGSHVYVADTEHEAVFAFDESGNYLETLGGDELGNVEGLSVFSERELIVVGRNRMSVLDVEDNTLRRISDLEGAGERMVSAVRDVNGDIVATDFDDSSLFVLTERPSLYTGLRVYVERIDSDSFPRIRADIRVEDRHGNPVVGLRESNFVITEDSAAVEDKELRYAADTDRNPQVSLLVDRSESMRERRDRVAEVAESVHDTVTEHGEVRLIVGGSEPFVELTAGAGVETFSRRSAQAGEYGDGSGFDIAVRLAAGELLRGGGRRSVSYVTDGRLPDAAFETYDLDEVTAYLRNNGIQFDILQLGSGSLDSELEYMVSETGGTTVRPEQAREMRPYEEVIDSRPSGRYVLEYRTLKDGDFGRQYLPFEVEAVLGRRSGRGESGYFAPYEQ
ncbi:MAG: hypothetical protein ACOCRN_00750, partial [Spirochaetia bacterium]